MKKAISVLMVCLMLLSLAACGGAGKQGEEDKSMKSYKISTTIYISSEEGELDSVSFCRDLISDSYSVGTKHGSFTIDDEIKEMKDGYLIHRSIKPTGNEEYGYRVVSEIETDYSFKKSSYFCPGRWYGNDELRFSKHTKYPLHDNIATGPIDTMTAPFVAVYNKQRYLKLSDVSFSKCDTVTEDYSTHKNNILIDAHIDIPGIGVKKHKGKVSLLHEYPANSYNYSSDEPITVQRFVPLDKEISVSFEITSRETSDFEQCMKDTFREEFERRYSIDETVDENDVLKTLVNYVSGSYREIDGIPHLMACTQHFVNESGFLYRNTDLAYLLLKFHYEGYEIPIDIDKLIKVIDSQVALKRCAENQFFDFIRSRVEGVEAVFDAYCLLKEHGIEKNDWLDLVKAEADYYKTLDEYFSITFFLKLADYGINPEDNTKTAIAKAEKLCKEKIDKYYFVGAIVDTDLCLDKETGVLGLQHFIELFKATGDRKYLEYAGKCADYLETYQILQDFTFEAYGERGNRDCNIISLGNNRINLRGLSYVSAKSSAGDHINYLAISYLNELGNFLNDNHYKKMALYIERNSLPLINRNDKACALDDFMFSTKDGYVPEFYQTGASGGYCSGRGYGQDSALGWVYYVYLFNSLRLKETTGSYFLYASKGQKAYYNNLATQAQVTLNDEPNPFLTDRNYDIFVKVNYNDVVSMKWKESIPAELFVMTFQNQFMEYSFTVSYLQNGRLMRESTVNNYVGRAYEEAACDADEILITFKSPNPNSYLSQIQVFGIGTYRFEEAQRPQCSNDVFFGQDKSMELTCENRTFQFDSKDIGWRDEISDTFFTKCNVLHLHEKKVSFHMQAEYDGNLMIHVRDYPYYNPNDGETGVDVFIDDHLIDQTKVNPSDKIGAYFEAPIKKGECLRLDFYNINSMYQVIEFVVNNTY